MDARTTLGMESRARLSNMTIDTLISAALQLLIEQEAISPSSNKAQFAIRVSQISDATTPIYTVELLKLAVNDTSLATTPPGLDSVFDNARTATAIIAANVECAISDALWQFYYREWESRILGLAA